MRATAPLFFLLTLFFGPVDFVFLFSAAIVGIMCQLVVKAAAAGDAFAARLARAGAPGAPSEATQAPQGSPGPYRTRRPRPRPRGHPISRTS